MSYNARPAEHRSDGDSIRVEINYWPRRTMDSIRVSEAPDPGSIPGEATKNIYVLCISLKNLDHDFIYKGHCVNPEVSSNLVAL